MSLLSNNSKALKPFPSSPIALNLLAISSSIGFFNDSRFVTFVGVVPSL